MVSMKKLDGSSRLLNISTSIVLSWPTLTEGDGCLRMQKGQRVFCGSSVGNGAVISFVSKIPLLPLSVAHLIFALPRMAVEVKISPSLSLSPSQSIADWIVFLELGQGILIGNSNTSPSPIKQLSKPVASAEPMLKDVILNGCSSRFSI